MFASKNEPWEFASLDELLALASAMEQQAIDGYLALRERMTALGHPELAVVFDTLIAEETGHLGKVGEWRVAANLGASAPKAEPPTDVFDDEGSGLVAPELLTAYRAFSMAVRNEERAFMFWTYVSANAHSDEIKHAAERMAREELGHVATLRRERRKAFHMVRSQDSDVATDLVALERLLAEKLDLVSGTVNDVADEIRSNADAARSRAESISNRPFGRGVTRRISTKSFEKALPISEHLLDCYLDLGDLSNTEQDAGRARTFASELIACLRALRG